VARVVRAAAGDDRGLAAELGDGDRDQAPVLVVGERRRLAGRAADDDAVRAVRDEVPEERGERLLVDAAAASNG
jgi:hypothetical protein